MVKLKPGKDMTREELLEWCREKLPVYNRHKRMEFVEIPKIPTNKLMKHELSLRYGGKESAF